eukprot:Lithocolla_globosa_v1_NODE_3988_length_1535_cov_24.136486.p2 type:complete len:126 gc:universal NODE_3988_length_1535_cov_24.136486:548-171(-)
MQAFPCKGNLVHFVVGLKCLIRISFLNINIIILIITIFLHLRPIYGQCCIVSSFSIPTCFCCVSHPYNVRSIVLDFPIPLFFKKQMLFTSFVPPSNRFVTHGIHHSALIVQMVMVRTVPIMGEVG